MYTHIYSFFGEKSESSFSCYSYQKLFLYLPVKKKYSFQKYLSNEDRQVCPDPALITFAYCNL